MTVIAFWNPSDDLLVWGVNVLLQVSLVTAVALAVAACARRSPTVRYWVLYASLLLVICSPLTSAA